MLYFETVLQEKQTDKTLYINTKDGVFNGITVKYDNSVGHFIGEPNDDRMTVGELKAQLKTLMEELAPTRPHFILEEEIGTNLSTFHFTPALAQKRFGIGAEYFAIGTDIDILNTFVKRRQFDISRHCNASMQNLEDTLFGYDDPEMRSKVDLNPVFQRGHVWTKEQQIAYVENFLRSPQSINKTIYLNDLFLFNSVSKVTAKNNMVSDKIVCLDGLQRLTAVLDFINGKFEIFGGLRYEDILNSPDKSKILGKCNFDIYYLSLQTNKEVIDFYVDFNAGGTPHTKEEIERVKNLI